jgi:hypothetical protein
VKEVDPAFTESHISQHFCGLPLYVSA